MNPRYPANSLCYHRASISVKPLGSSTLNSLPISYIGNINWVTSISRFIYLNKKCQKETVLTIEGTTNPAHADISINYPIWNKIQLGEEDLYSQISP